MLQAYRDNLVADNKSENTVSTYSLHIKKFLEWYNDTYGEEFVKLYRPNVLDYISYLRNIKKLDAKTVNAKLSAMTSFNEFLVSIGTQDDMVINKKDYIKVQTQYASPATIDKKDVEQFRQALLVNQNARDWAIATVLSYGGMRISECCNLHVDDVDLLGREIKVVNGKGDKQRVVYINDKIVNAIKEYLKERKSDSAYLFISREGGKLNRTRINQIFNKYSDKITPHTLRHFFCSNALESGAYTLAECANQAGHANIHTTMLYTNPSREKMKEKANRL